MKLLASEGGLCYVEFVSGTWLHPSLAVGFGEPHGRKYRFIRNDCRGFNNLSYTIHL